MEWHLFEGLCSRIFWKGDHGRTEHVWSDMLFNIQKSKSKVILGMSMVNGDKGAEQYWV